MNPEPQCDTTSGYGQMGPKLPSCAVTHSVSMHLNLGHCSSHSQILALRTAAKNAEQPHKRAIRALWSNQCRQQRGDSPSRAWASWLVSTAAAFRPGLHTISTVMDCRVHQAVTMPMHCDSAEFGVAEHCQDYLAVSMYQLNESTGVRNGKVLRTSV